MNGAARVIGVSQQTFVQKLKSAELEGGRVQTGRRTAWRPYTCGPCGDEEPMPDYENVLTD